MFHVVLHRSGPRWDPSQPLEEQSDWPAHASFMDGLVDAGFIVLGGPLADEHRVVHAVEAESGRCPGPAASSPVRTDPDPRSASTVTASPGRSKENACDCAAIAITGSEASRTSTN